MQFELIDPEIKQPESTQLRLEVQVRAAAADAWYVADHRLCYKRTVQLPSELRRKVLRLIVLTELFDEEVSAVIAHQAELPEYGLARLYEQLLQKFQPTTGDFVESTRREGLREILITAYTDDETAELERRVLDFVGRRGQNWI